MANTQDLRELEKDPRLFLYTSLTAGSSHIITATSRLETILKANKIPFQAIDIATDELHRKLWQRRAGQRKLPGLVKEGYVLGDLEEVEEWNEYGELKDNIGPVAGAPSATSSSPAAAVPAPKLPVIPTATAGTTNVTTKSVIDTSKMVALPGAAEIKARNNPLPISSPEDAAHPEKMTSAPAEKEKSIAKSIKFKGDVDKQAEHLSAPPSAIPSKSVTPGLASTDTAAKGAEDVGDAADDHKETQGTSAEAKTKQSSMDSKDVDAPARDSAETPRTEHKALDPVSSTVAVETGEIDEPDASSPKTAALTTTKTTTTTTTTTTTSDPEQNEASLDSDAHASKTSEVQQPVSAMAPVKSPVDEAEKKVDSLNITNDAPETQLQAAADPSAATQSVED